MYYKIDFKTHSMAVYGAIIKIVRKSNVVKRRITLNYDLTIKTSKDHLYDDLVNALNKAGIDPSYYKLVSTPYERKAPKKRKKPTKKWLRSSTRKPSGPRSGELLASFQHQKERKTTGYADTACFIAHSLWKSVSKSLAGLMSEQTAKMDISPFGKYLLSRCFHAVK